MKNGTSNDTWSYIFMRRIHGNVFAWNEPASKSERSKQITENILRWEDDGGPVTETRSPLGQVAEINTAHRR
jgi:hypothetical protein